MYSKTKNYDQFKIPPNRPVSLVHVEKLVDANRKLNLMDCYPIIVNDKMELFDGQHRLQAARILDVEIYYIIKKDLVVDDSSLLLINSQTRKHTLHDKIEISLKYGNPEMLKAEKLWHLNTAIPFHVTCQVLGSQTGTILASLSRNSFSVKYEKHYKELVLLLEDLDIMKKIKYGATFVLGLSVFMHKFPHLKDTLKKNAHKIKSASSRHDYVRILVDACS